MADAVLARLRRLSARCREAVEQLSVVPTPVDFELAEALLDGRLDALTEAEDTGILRVRAGGLVFRHELARRAVEQSLSGLRRRGLHAAVVRALRAAPEPQLARLVHHATEAGDGATVSRFAPQAGREAVAAGSHRQALAHFAAALRHAHRLEPAELARVVDEHAWELYNAHRYRGGVGRGRAGGRAVPAVGRRARAGHGAGPAVPAPLHGRRHPGRRAARPRRRCGCSSAGDRAAYRPRRGGLRRHLPRGRAGAERPAGRRQRGAGRALELARRAGRPDLVALSSNYRSIADADLDEEQRLDLLRSSLALALEHGSHETAARAYNNLTELLYRYHRLDELEQVLAAGQRFVVERGFPSHAYDLAVHRCLLDLRRGLVRQRPGTGCARWCRATPTWACSPSTACRRTPGCWPAAATPRPGRCWSGPGSRPTEQRLLHGLAFAGAALLEWAWLNDRPDRAAEVLAAWRPHAGRPGAEQPTAELLRYAARAGLPVEEFPGCPQPWAAGLRGDWAGAARRWAEIGDPYEQALELADSGEVEPTLTALRVLEDLGATAAARLVRRKLRALGITRVPRRSHASTRANPAGLTQRQLDVLDLLADGLTNAEIADRLVVSVRTVDSHVAAVLSKLGVRTRREAARLRRP